MPLGGLHVQFFWSRPQHGRGFFGVCFPGELSVATCSACALYFLFLCLSARLCTCSGCMLRNLLFFIGGCSGACSAAGCLFIICLFLADIDPRFLSLVAGSVGQVVRANHLSHTVFSSSYSSLQNQRTDPARAKNLRTEPTRTKHLRTELTRTKHIRTEPSTNKPTKTSSQSTQVSKHLTILNGLAECA